MEKEQGSSFFEDNKKPLMAIGLAVVLTIIVFFLFLRPDGLQTLNEKFFPKNTEPQAGYTGQEQANEESPVNDAETSTEPQDIQNTYPQRDTGDQQTLGQNWEEGTAERESSQSEGNSPAEGEAAQEENPEISPLSCSDLEGRICENGTTCSQPVQQTIDTTECCFGECV